MSQEIPLIRMGYRKLSDRIWAKPIHHSLLTYEIETKTVSYWFKCLDSGKNGLFHKSTCSELTVQNLKEAEAVCLNNSFSWRGRYYETNWDFLTKEEEAELLLDT
jgi:hypothetical protein